MKKKLFWALVIGIFTYSNAFAAGGDRIRKKCLDAGHFNSLSVCVDAVQDHADTLDWDDIILTSETTMTTIVDEVGWSLVNVECHVESAAAGGSGAGCGNG